MGSPAAPNPAWPADVVHAIRREAAFASFWEGDHRRVIGTLIEALHAAGIPVRITKGTALAYSLYEQPASRRRGDSDILIPAHARRSAREVLRACGFEQVSAARALQEDWGCRSALGFHVVDVHWRLNGSAAVSALLERGDCFSGGMSLEAMSRHAEGLDPIGNVILICVNRHSHGIVGYRVGEDKLFETDRLIWAVDLYLLTRSLDAAAWERLVVQAKATGTASIVQSGLAFLEAALGLAAPPQVAASLSRAPGGRDVAAYFATTSGARRLRMDLEAAAGPREKAKVALYALLPGEAFLRERFPEASKWPAMVLYLRRMAEGALKLVQGRS